MQATPARKIMLVTGASRGIGAAIATLAANRGYRVAINFLRQRQAADEVVQRIASAGGEAIAIGADVSQSREATRLFDEVTDKLGVPDAVVNNAGIIGTPRPIEEMEEQHLIEVFGANVFSTFYCTREAVRRMSHRVGGRGGVIVNMSSAAARHGGMPTETHYASSKAAIDGLTLGLAKEMVGSGIRVNALRPGLIETSIHDVHGGAAKVQALASSVPLGRAGTVEEVAEAVLWLTSDASSYVHGALVDISGGR